MGLPAKLLGADEHVVIHTRTHAKALILPALALILIGGGVGAGAALMPAEARPVGTLAVIAVGLLLVLWLVVAPYLRWLTTTYTVTNRRLITRSGILNKTGTDLPRAPDQRGVERAQPARPDPRLRHPEHLHRR